MRSEDDGTGVGQSGGAGFKDGVLQRRGLYIGHVMTYDREYLRIVVWTIF
jgi:hypothetical protein